MAVVGHGGVALAAGPPLVGPQWASAVGSAAAKLSVRVDPNGSTATYHFEYTTEAAYQADVAVPGHDGFAGAKRAPAADATIGISPLTVSQSLSSLTAGTTYRYRAVARNSSPGSPSTGPTGTFTTKAPGPLLADNRGWEMVSPIDKNGGQIDLPGAIAEGGVLQAAADGDSITYGSTGSFAGGFGGPLANQYVSVRSGLGWTTTNVTAPISYSSADGGVPYQLFSPDLSRALLLNGDHCAAGAGRCTVQNAPLPGTDAPPGYQDYYLREGGSFIALLGPAEAAELDLDPAHFDLRFAGASAGLDHVVLSTCAALTPAAVEVPLGPGCDPAAQNLYEWSRGNGLTLINGGSPGAELAAPAGAVSESGDRVYFTLGGNLFLRELSSGQTSQVDQGAGGGGSFQVASADGDIAIFLRSGHLWRYDAVANEASDLTPGGGVVGVLGASAGAGAVYFQDASGLKRWQSGAGITAVAPGPDAADPADFPPATGTARVSADGARLLFVSTAALTTAGGGSFDNTDLVSGAPDSQVYLYDANGPGLLCVSCNPTNGRPIGPSSIPGAVANGSVPGSTQVYKPRVLSADGKRVFFDSEDALAFADTNSKPATGAGIADVYEWEAQGEGGCAKAAGCVSLVSSGRSAAASVFVDSSADGADAFFITDESLVAGDPGSLDLYDARVNGGFPISSPPIPCEGDACQVLPSPPVDPTLTTLLSGHGNPPVHYTRYGKSRCKRGFVKRKGRCVRKSHRGRGHGRRHGASR